MKRKFTTNWRKMGNDITGFYSTDGATWTEVGKVTNDKSWKMTSRLDLLQEAEARTAAHRSYFQN